MPTAEEEAEEDKRERELADIITESQIPSGVDDDDEDDGHAHAASAAAQPTKLQQVSHAKLFLRTSSRPNLTCPDAAIRTKEAWERRKEAR